LGIIWHIKFRLIRYQFTIPIWFSLVDEYWLLLLSLDDNISNNRHHITILSPQSVKNACLAYYQSRRNFRWSLDALPI
jgi:hypothetical protein